MTFWFDNSKTRGVADRCRRQTVKQNLSPHFGVFGIFEGTLSRRQTGAGLSSMGGGSNWLPCSTAPNAVSASRESWLADCGSYRRGEHQRMQTTQ